MQAIRTTVTNIEAQILNRVRHVANRSVDNALGWEDGLRTPLNALGNCHVGNAAGELVIAGIRQGTREPGLGEPWERD